MTSRLWRSSAAALCLLAGASGAKADTEQQPSLVPFQMPDFTDPSIAVSSNPNDAKVCIAMNRNQQSLYETAIILTQTTLVPTPDIVNAKTGAVIVKGEPTPLPLWTVIFSGEKLKAVNGDQQSDYRILVIPGNEHWAILRGSKFQFPGDPKDPSLFVRARTPEVDGFVRVAGSLITGCLKELMMEKLREQGPNGPNSGTNPPVPDAFVPR